MTVKDCSTKGFPINASLWAMGEVIHDEPVLLERAGEETMLSARLMFTPDEICAVRDSAGERVPVEDIRIEGRNILVRAAPGLPSVSEDEKYPVEPHAHTIERHRDGRRLILFSEGHYFHDRQLAVTYRTRERWTVPPLPSPCRRELCRVHERLERGEPLTLVVIGDSISAGANASAEVDAPPFQPAYPELLARHLREGSASHVTLQNMSRGCMSSGWGREQCPAIIAARPDLLVIAFGMNDASGDVTVEEFRRNIEGTINTVRTTLPECECIVVSGMTPNPEWHVSRPGIRQEMHEQLSRLQGPGIAFCDVYSLWGELVRRKGFFSLTGNGVNHPNDFGHRLYADCLYAMFDLKGKRS